MASKRTLASFWNRTGGAGPSSASLPSTGSSDMSETDVNNERSTAGSSGYEHETDCETESCEGGEDATGREVHESGPSRKKRKPSKLTFKEEWKVKYLMVPVQNGDEMVCIQCREKMKVKSSTASRHIDRKHPTMASFSHEKKKRLVHLYESRLKDQQAILQSALNSDELTILAPYKLAFVIGKHKMPFSSCLAFLEFARCADPDSVVFSRMPASRDTITRRTQDLHQQVLKPAVVQGVKQSPYWSLIADESTDSSTHEQLSLFVRYINLQEQKVVEEFLEMKRIVGHPTTANLFTAVMECIEKEAADDSLPTE